MRYFTQIAGWANATPFVVAMTQEQDLALARLGAL